MATIDIVGGGVAGLALAAGLDPSKFHVRLHEAEPDRRPLGTVYGIWPPAMAALQALGLAEHVRAVGRPAQGATLRTASGRILVSARGPADAWLVRRPDLLTLLTDSVPATVARVSHRVTDPRDLDGDVVVGADGAYSAVRDRIWGAGARHTGTMALRGVVPGEVTRFHPGHRGLHEFWGRRSLFGITASTGGTTNWYAATAEFETTPTEALRWARDHFSAFPAAVRAVLAEARPELTLVNRVIEAPTLTRLAQDRFALVGDAAHAMSPNLGRGACEALVDAATLAECLSTRPLSAALAAYTRRRLLGGQLTRVASAAVRRAALSVR